MTWERVKKSDPAAVAIANRHYSRQAFGKQGVMLGPPGRLICFRVSDYAVWVSHWPYARLALDGLDSYRCTMFRNERRDPAPLWITWVAPGLVSSDNPGYCFKRAGWVQDRDWRGRGQKGVRLIRLRAARVREAAP